MQGTFWGTIFMCLRAFWFFLPNKMINYFSMLHVREKNKFMEYTECFMSKFWGKLTQYWWKLSRSVGSSWSWADPVVLPPTAFHYPFSDPGVSQNDLQIKHMIHISRSHTTSLKFTAFKKCFNIYTQLFLSWKKKQLGEDVITEPKKYCQQATAVFVSCKQNCFAYICTFLLHRWNRNILRMSFPKIWMLPSTDQIHVWYIRTAHAHRPTAYWHYRGKYRKADYGLKANSKSRKNKSTEVKWHFSVYF